jgi:hypothetical protein
VKLYGSVTWLKREETGEIEEKDFNIDQGYEELGTGNMYSGEIVIYPLRQKHLYVDPYIQMFYCLNKELESRKVWIVVGYSFRDPVIQHIFDINLKDGKKMILIHPDPNEVRQRFPKQDKDSIIAIDKHFGRGSEMNIVNNALKEELAKLSDL